MRTKRHGQKYKTWYSDSKEVKHHVYLCDHHWQDIDDFMKAYEGKEKDA